MQIEHTVTMRKKGLKQMVNSMTPEISVLGHCHISRVLELLYFFKDVFYVPGDISDKFRI